MNNFLKYPSIGQFRNMVKHVQKYTQFEGVDENGEPIFNHAAIMPVLKFIGKVKVHGTNAGVTLDVATGVIHTQSRQKEISVGNDNAGFAQFVETTGKDGFTAILNALAIVHTDAEKITVFGEWAGGNIQKGIGINGVDKFFAGFEYSVIFSGHEEPQFFELPSAYHFELQRIFHVDSFGTWEIDIDFSNPDKIINELTNITFQIEDNCPAGRYLGNEEEENIGEGVVWSHSIEEGEILRFKVKGSKHSSSKVKKLATVDPEKIASIDKFIDYAVTENRLEQGFDEVDIRNVGKFIKWVNQDVAKEEADTLTANNLEMRDVGRMVSNKARMWFIEKYC